jgi:rfaE bifunctional protein kinase chain/domain
VGDDDDGKKMLQRMEDQGMSKEGIIISRERPTTVKTRIIASHQHVVRIDEESDGEVNANEERMMLEKITQLLPQCQVVVFEDYDKGSINLSIIEKSVALAMKHNIPTVVDPKKRNFLSYENVTLFKPNLKELREGLKMDVEASNQIQVEQAAARLKEKLKAKGIMVTLSDYGVYIDFENHKIKLPAYQREIADVSGAGDTVVSVAALCTALKLHPKLIAALSNLAGGLVCQHVGVVPIDRNELLTEAIKELEPVNP